MKHPALIHGIYSIKDLQSHYERMNSNGHWFDKQTMKFFDTRISEQLFYAGSKCILFITSEKPTTADLRKFSIRFYNVETGEIGTVGYFRGFNTTDTAKRQANKLALNMTASEREASLTPQK